MPVLASAEDLATQLQETVNTAQAEQALELVEAEVLERYGPEKPLPTGNRLLRLRRVVLTAAIRIYDNPTALTTDTLGPSTEGRSAVVALTDDELSTIRDVASGSRAATASSIALSSPYFDEPVT